MTARISAYPDSDGTFMVVNETREEIIDTGLDKRTAEYLVLDESWIAAVKHAGSHVSPHLHQHGGHA